MEILFLICSCYSIEHQLQFYYDKEDASLSTLVYLNHRGFWQRLKYGLLYILGRKSNYGAWDEFFFTEESASKLKEFLTNNNIVK